MLDDSDIALVNDWLYQNGSEVVCDAFDRIKKELAEAQKTPTNKQIMPCQHAFYAVRFAGLVRCSKCKKEFPLISTC